MSFKIATKKVFPTAVMQLVDPETDLKLTDDAGKPVFVELYGKASPQYTAALSALSRKNLARKGKAQSFEVNVADNIDILVAVSKTSNLELEDGTLVTTAEAFKALYSDPTYYWIKDQVQSTLEDTTAFLQK